MTELTTSFTIPFIAALEILNKNGLAGPSALEAPLLPN